MTSPSHRRPVPEGPDRPGTGTYLLLMEPPSGAEVTVGKLGTLPLDGGWLVYVGSAFGSGGLRARIGRHLSPKSTLHWHVDHLLDAVAVSEAWFTTDSRRLEEEWIEALRSRPGAENPLPRFGSGDCGCEGHLLRFPERPQVERLPEWLEERGVGGCEMEGGAAAELTLP